MADWYRILRFGMPYLRRYWLRFALGVVLGLLFGFSNGLVLGGVSIVLNRLSDAGASVPARGALALAATTSTASPTATETAPPPAATAPRSFFSRLGQEFHAVADPVSRKFRAEGTRIKTGFMSAIDPWLPRLNRNLDWKQILGGVMLIPLLTAFRGLMSYATTYLLAWSSQRIIQDVREDIFRKINSLSLDFFHRTSTAELLSRLNDDSTSVSVCLKLGLSDVVKEPSTILCLLIALLLISWKLTIVALAFAPLCLIPTRRVAKKIKAQERGDNNVMIGQNALAMESFQNVRVTKAYELGEAHARLYRRAGQASNRIAMKTTQARAMLHPVVETLNSFGIGAVIIYTFWSHIPFQDLIKFILALILFFTPFKKLSGVSVYFTSAGIALDRLIALFALEPTVKEPANPKPLPGFTRALSFDNVSFTYGPDLPEVLQQVSFSLPRGHRLGLAGESGSGKSSLVNLLFRFYDPSSGRIEIDGAPIDQVKIADLRAQMALVSQDVLLFDASVAENIGFGKTGATREEIIAAAKEAYAHDFIQSLPQGYDTPLGERGLRLSGGQRQRIAIARAFVRNAPLLVLDEATASLDSQAEAEVQRAIDHLAENRTVVCVAHRLSTLRAMDEIIVLEKGRILEQGGFEELLGRRGVFAAMAARQSIYPQAA